MLNCISCTAVGHNGLNFFLQEHSHFFHFQFLRVVSSRTNNYEYLVNKVVSAKIVSTLVECKEECLF